MRVYSDYDFLGKQLGLKDIPGSDLVSKFVEWIENSTKTVLLKTDIPNMIYLKTEVICETINHSYKKYKVKFTAPVLVGCLYNHFVLKAFNNKNGLKHAYDVLTKYEESPEQMLYHHIVEQVSTYTNPQNSKTYAISIQLNKSEIKKGEMLLYELDDLYGHNFTVETMIRAIWMDFINERRKMTEKKIITDIIEIIEDL